MNVLRAEWMKWRTVRMHWLLLGVAAALPIVVSILTAIFTNDGMITRGTVYELALGTSYVTAILSGVAAAVVTSGEYGHLTIRPTFAAIPRRGAVLAAKAALAVVIGIVTEVIVLVVSTNASFAILEGRDMLTDESSATVRPAMIGAVAFVALMALIGHSLGALLRSAPLAITTIILWPLLVEGIVGALLFAITKDEQMMEWLPFRAGFEMLAYNPWAAPEGEWMMEQGLTRLEASLYFGAISVGLTLLASAVASRRDS